MAVNNADDTLFASILMYPATAACIVLPGNSVRRLLVSLLMLSVGGCIQPKNDVSVPALLAVTKSLFVHVPDHPKDNPGSFRIGDEAIDAAEFETELRKRLLSKQYDKIELSTGKAGDDHFEGLVKRIAIENQTAIVELPAPRAW